MIKPPGGKNPAAHDEKTTSEGNMHHAAEEINTQLARPTQALLEILGINSSRVSALAKERAITAEKAARIVIDRVLKKERAA